MRVINIVKVD